MGYNSYFDRQCRTRVLEGTSCRPLYTARSRNSGYSLRSAWTCLALQLDAVHAKILEIERVSLVVTSEIVISHQKNYD